MANTIQIFEPNSETILKEFPLEEIEMAHAFALKMEQMGLDIEIKTPSVAETLVSSLGANEQEMNSLRKEIIAEIEAHNECPDS
ncbi:MAG: hypothetical protein HN576_15625 [Bacteriovoracaceae bacterium]|jgi:hypothetical protein|nr:hypothetical protein [Bacteriovoracaceae bacterium]